MWKKAGVIALVGLTFPVTAAAQDATSYDGVEFPHGDESFAESVIDYYVDDAGVEESYSDPEAALGTPDYDHSEATGAVSLGNAVEDERAGELIVAFDSNRLVDVEGDDLYIFEVGPAVEASVIAISIDNETYYEIGQIEGSTRGIDLADYPEVPENRGFRYVRIRDFVDGETTGAPSAGPDIDAVGAIGSVDAELIGEDGRFLDDVANEEGDDMDCACSGTNGGGSSMALLLMFGFVFLRRMGRRRRA